MPEQWEERLQAGKGVCGLGMEEEAGRWPCSPQPRGNMRAAACATSTPFSSHAEKQPEFPGMLHQNFAAALYFTPLFSAFSFLTEL